MDADEYRPTDGSTRPMASAVQARLRRGLAGQGTAQIVGLVVQLGSVPLFLLFWGTALYGEWLLLAALAPWLVFSNLGLTPAALNDVMMAVARGDRDGALGTFQTAWVLTTCLSSLTALLLGTGTALFALADWFEFATLGHRDAWLIVALLLLQTLLHMQAELAAAGLYGAGQYGLHAFVAASTRLGSFALLVLALVLGGSPIGAAAAMVVAECGGLAVTIAVARRYGPWMRYGFSRVSFPILRRLVGPSLGFVGLSASNALTLQAPLLVVGTVAGPAAVAVFATLRIPARVVVLLGGALLAVLRPEMAMAHGVGNAPRLCQLHTLAVQTSLWLGVAGFAGLMLFGAPLVEIWTAGRVVVEQPLFGWLAAGSAILLMCDGVTSALHATNRHKEIAVVHLVMAGLATAVSAGVAPHAGASGVAATLAVAHMLVLVLAMARALAFVEQRLGALAVAAARPPIPIFRWLLRGKRP